MDMDYNKGGLGMVNIFTFENNCFKSNWLNNSDTSKIFGQLPSKYLIPHKLIRHVNQRIFQYKITHRLASTNKKLKTCKIKDNFCDRCKEEIKI